MSPYEERQIPEKKFDFAQMIIRSFHISSEICFEGDTRLSLCL